jgi:hypothetical protein
VKAELERIEIPGEHDARERAWTVLESAFTERPVAEHRTHMLRPAVAIAIVAAALAAVLSSPGRAVLDDLREVVGVERAQPALFSLPSDGRLLVASDAGVWVVQRDGSKRLLGPYREASWSPLGRFVVAARENELAALEPDGHVRWTLARPGAHSPRWTGTDSDTRIAYVDRTGVRVVAGDGTGDRLVVPEGRGPIAWRPGPGFVLAYAGSRGRVVMRDLGTGGVIGRSRAGSRPRTLVWSSDGTRLLAIAPFSVRVLDGRGRQVTNEGPSDGTSVLADVFLPRSHDVVEIRREGAGSNVFRWGDGRSLFRGAGAFRDLDASPDARWLLVTWPAADQWVFISANGRGIRAVANVSEQFRSREFPRVEGWCCRK